MTSGWVPHPRYFEGGGRTPGPISSMTSTEPIVGPVPEQWTSRLHGRADTDRESPDEPQALARGWSGAACNNRPISLAPHRRIAARTSLGVAIRVIRTPKFSPTFTACPYPIV